MVDDERELAVEGRGVSETGRRRVQNLVQESPLSVGQLSGRLAQELGANSGAFVFGELGGEPGQTRVVRVDRQIVPVPHRFGIVRPIRGIPDVDQDGPRRLAGGVSGIVLEDRFVGTAPVQLPGRVAPNVTRPRAKPPRQWRRLAAWPV